MGIYGKEGRQAANNAGQSYVSNANMSYVCIYVCMKTRFCDRRVQISSSLAAGSRSMELCSPVQGNPTWPYMKTYPLSEQYSYRILIWSGVGTHYLLFVCRCFCTPCTRTWWSHWLCSGSGKQLTANIIMYSSCTIVVMMAPTTIITITTITTTTITTNPTSTTANTNSNTTTSTFTAYITKPFCISAISPQCLVLLCTTRGSTPPSTSHWVCQSSSTASWTEIFRPNSFSKTQRYAYHTFIDTYARPRIMPNIIHANKRAYMHHSYIQTYSTSQKDIYLKPTSLAMWIANAIEYAVIICLLSYYTAYLTYTVCTNAHMYVCMHACALLYELNN